MTDLSTTVEPKSDQLNSDDLIGRSLTVRITKIGANPGAPEQPISIYFEGDNGKPYKPCKSMRRVLINTWGADGSKYPGRSLTLYRDPAVKFGGLEVGGIRISHMSDIERPVTMALTASRANRKPYTVQPISAAPKPAKPQAEQRAINVENLALARDAARGGTDVFRTWWKGATPDERDDAKSVMAELQGLCATADAEQSAREFEMTTEAKEPPA